MAELQVFWEGVAVAGQLADRGEPVLAVNRTGRANVPAGVNVVAADVADPEQARLAGADAEVVNHCAARRTTVERSCIPR